MLGAKAPLPVGVDVAGAVRVFLGSRAPLGRLLALRFGLAPGFVGAGPKPREDAQCTA